MSRREASKGPPRAAGTKASADPAPHTPNDATAALNAAVQHHRAGRLDEAETLYRRLLRSHPEHPDAVHLLGVIAHQRGQNAAAEDLIRKAIQSSPRVADYHNNLGNALQAQGKRDEAEASFRRALGLDPRLARAHNNLGNMLRERGELADAAESYRRALALDPSHFGALNNLGNVLKALRRLDEAEASYRKALQIKPDFATGLTNLGDVLTKQGSIVEAEESMRRAAKVKPDFAAAHRKLGTLLKVLGRYDEAEESLKRALDLNPDDTEARYHHATVHKFVPGDPEIEKLKELIERKGMSEDQRNPLLFALGEAYDDIGLYADAFSYYRQANDEKVSRVKFNASRYRKQIIEIKRVFRDQRCSASKSLGEAEHVPVFIVGMSNSGKTLVESLLSQHEDVFGAGESLKWINSIGKVLEKSSISEPFPNFMGFLVDEQIRDMGKIYMEGVSKYSPESRFFVNTRPEHCPYVGLILQALPFARVIYCRRDPLDNCLFIYFKRYPSGSPNFYDLRSMASYYADHQDLMAHWLRLYGDRILDVRYEDLVRNPAASCARLYEYCGLEYDPRTIHCALKTDEIGHWKHYESYLGPLRQALCGLTR